ncbi:MAG: TauD/TfdA family dioxygenase [Cyanobacteria bacterium J06554_1]
MTADVHIDESKSLPLLVASQSSSTKLSTWANAHLRLIEDKLVHHGGILFRNFEVGNAEDFQDLVELISRRKTVEYNYRSTPRTTISGKIYTSTEYPPHQTIPLHNENSYSSNWPLNIAFFCLRPAQEGGQTPIADSRKIYQRISEKTKKSFLEKNIMYVRNFGEVGLPWQEVFQTNDKDKVEAYCKDQAITFEWLNNDGLKVSQVLPAVLKHPITEDLVWFNQAHLFHISSLPDRVRTSLLEIFSLSELPRNAYYGDGSIIDDLSLEEIRQVYEQETVMFSWEKNDVLFLDNLLVAHGRKPFSGKRELLVGMA